MIDPKDVIRDVTVEELCDTAERYFSRIADYTHHLSKPFGSASEAPELLQNMGLLLSGLGLEKTMTVLEFGAGTCWFSRSLNQLQCEVVACDVSQTALDIGKELFEKLPVVGEHVQKVSFLRLNGHTIDLPDCSVDRIVCMDAFHHVPNQREILGEMFRVLRDGGIAGFSEPGRNHSQAPQSQYEMANFKVLENDIMVEDIASMAAECGFSETRIKASYGCDLSIEDYLVDSLNGSGTFLASASHPITSRIVFFLHKGVEQYDSRGVKGLAGKIELAEREFTIQRGQFLRFPAVVTNSGAAKWLTSNVDDIGVVKIGIRLYSDAGDMIDMNYSRQSISSQLDPGDSVSVDINVQFETPGCYILGVDLLSEKIAWFENLGCPLQKIKVNVI